MTDALTPVERAGTEGLVAEWRKAMEGVTPGPWTYIAPVPFEGDDENEAGGFVYPGGIEGDDGNPVCVFGDPSGSATMFENTADHDWIARCSPDHIAKLLAALDAQADRIRALTAEVTRWQAVAETAWQHGDVVASERMYAFLAKSGDEKPHFKAFNAIAEAEAKVAGLAGAVEPFADWIEHNDAGAIKAGFKPGFDEYAPSGQPFTLGQFRCLSAARDAALSASGPGTAAGIAAHMPSAEWLRQKIESDPDDAECEVRPSLASEAGEQKAGAVQVKADLTEQQASLLKWLGGEETRALGECKGVGLPLLVDLGLATIEPSPPEYDDVNYCRVRITPAGRAALATENAQNQGDRT